MTAALSLQDYICLALCVILLCHMGLATHFMVRLLAEVQKTSSLSFAILRSLDNGTTPEPDCSEPDVVFFGGRKFRYVMPEDGVGPVCDELIKYQLTGIAERVSAGTSSFNKEEG